MGYQGEGEGPGPFVGVHQAARSSSDTIMRFLRPLVDAQKNASARGFAFEPM